MAKAKKGNRKRKQKRKAARKKVKKRRGPKFLKEGAKPPKKAGMLTRMQLRSNEDAAPDTMKAYRAGFNACWKWAPKRCTEFKLKKPNGFDSTNQHGGRLWATRRECKVTGKHAALILESCFLAGMGKFQLQQVKKNWSYAYFLKTGNKGENFKEVTKMWKSMTKFPKAKRPLLPDRVPTPKQLKTCLTTPWNDTNGMPLVDWSVGLLGFWDWAVCGWRHNADIEKKLKKSTQHVIEDDGGHFWTQMASRSKLPGKKRGTRPWKVHRLCFCPGGKHVHPPDVFNSHLDDVGNLKDGPPTWHTTCPVAAWQVIDCLQAGAGISKKERKLYKKWTPKTKYTDAGVKTVNIPDVIERANEFMVAQGANVEEHFPTNSGRKSLAAWLGELQIPYEESHEIHGDTFKVWKKNYQHNCLNPGKFGERRTQSPMPELALKAFRKLRSWCGVAKMKHKLERSERLNYAMLKMQGMDDASLQKILDGVEGWENV